MMALLHVIVGNDPVFDKVGLETLIDLGCKCHNTPYTHKDKRIELKKTLEASKSEYICILINDYISLKWLDIINRQNPGEYKIRYYVAKSEEDLESFDDYTEIQCDLFDEFSDLFDAEVDLTMGNLGK